MREFAIKIVTLLCIITIVTIVKMISLVYHFANKICQTALFSISTGKIVRKVFKNKQTKTERNKLEMVRKYLGYNFL